MSKSHRTGATSYRLAFGPAGQRLVTAHGPERRATLGIMDYEVGILAGDRPLNPNAARLLLPAPNDGKVTMSSTRLAAMADHRVIPRRTTA